MSSVGPLIPTDDEDVLTSVTPKYELPDAQANAAPPQRPLPPAFAADKEDPTFVSAVMEVGTLDVLPANVHEDPTVQVAPGQEAQMLAAAQGPTPGGDRTQDIDDKDFLEDPSVLKKPLPQDGSMPRAQKTLVGMNDLPTRPTEFGVVPLEAIGGGSNMTPHPPFELLEDPAAPNAPTVPGGALVARRQQNRVRSFVLGAAAAIVAIIGIGVVVKLAFGEPTGSALPPPAATTKTAAAPPPKNDPSPAADTAKADSDQNKPETAKNDPAPADTAKADPPAPAADDSASSSGWSGSAPAPIPATPAIATRPTTPRPQTAAPSQPQPRSTVHPPPARPSGGGGGKSGKGSGIVRDTPF
jgi:hypothetical protein